MTIALLLAAAAMQSLPAPTLDRWHRVGGDDRGDVAVDPQSIDRSGDEVTALVRIDVVRGTRTGTRVVGVLRYVYNCRASTYRMEAADLYDADGRFIGAPPLSPENRTDAPVPPDTPNATVRDYLCGAPQRPGTTAAAWIEAWRSR